MPSETGTKKSGKRVRNDAHFQWVLRGHIFFFSVWTKDIGWMNQAYSRLSTTHGHITDCKLLCMYWTRLVLVRPADSLYSASPLNHHPTGKQWCPNPDHYSDSEPARQSLTPLCWALSRAAEPKILTSFVWRGRGSNHQPSACQANAQPLHYPAAVVYNWVGIETEDGLVWVNLE